MSRAAFTVKAFGVYLLLLGAALVFVPNLLLSLLGMPPTTEVWIRVVGVLVFNIGELLSRRAPPAPRPGTAGRCSPASMHAQSTLAR